MNRPAQPVSWTLLCFQILLRQQEQKKKEAEREERHKKNEAERKKKDKELEERRKQVRGQLDHSDLCFSVHRGVEVRAEVEAIVRLQGNHQIRCLCARKSKICLEIVILGTIAN